MAHREIERTYAPAEGSGLPVLTRLPGVAAIGESTAAEMSAAYFDTADLALTRAGVSLRRRAGGADEGWHLKVPAGRGRDEIQLPLTDEQQPPRELVELVLGWTRGATLGQVATIRTRRSTYPLLDGAGAVLAEVADDHVSGSAADGVASVAWREWEVELVDGTPDLLAAADELMATIGVSPSAVQRRLADQVAELLRRDSEIRRGKDEGVHRARVACRRLRSALATFRPLVDRDVTDPLRDEIKWLGSQLAGARDARVVRERLTDLLREESPAAGAAQQRIDDTYVRRREVANHVVATTLASERYLDLLAALDRLVTEPPWTDAARSDARDVMPPRVRKDWKRLRRRVESAQAVEVGEDRDLAMHEARKAAKRLRYGAEVLRPVAGKDAKRLVKAAKRVTTLLGERQDTVMSRAGLEDLASQADAAGEDSFVFGRLHAREEQRAADLDEEFTEVWAKVRRPRLRRWLG
jgi:CHAD domain-containing protein